MKHMILRYSKGSIARRLALIFVGFFIVMLVIFTSLAYIITERTLIDTEKTKVNDTLDHVVSRLSAGVQPYTLTTLAEVIYQDAITDDILEQEGRYYFSRTDRDVTNMLYSNQDVFIYNKSHELLFTTADSDLLEFKDYQKIEKYYKNGKRGLMISKNLYSNMTGERIGAVQIFHDLNYYYNMRRQLSFAIFGIQFMSLLIGFLSLRYITKKMLKPLEDLTQLMITLSENPDDLTLRSEIKTGNEFEELSRIFDGMLDRLEEYGKLQSRFISDVSHELRTPIAVIQGHLGLLRRWGKNDPKVLDESLEASYHESNRMSLMINEMLATVRLKGNFEQHRQETTDVIKIVETVVFNFKVLYPDGIYQIETSCDSLMARVYDIHFEQALTIIFDNAVKYSTEQKSILVIISQSDQEAIVTIKDKGEGIAEEDLKHIFERFYRTDKSRNRVSTQAGLGIGLSILKQIVNGYHGKINIQSEVGVGTTMTLYFPLAQ